MRLLVTWVGSRLVCTGGEWKNYFQIMDINGGLLYGKLDEKTGGVIISFDREGTEVAAEVYGLERVESITVMDAPDQWESAVSAVHLEIVAGDSVVTVPNIIDFETEAGFNAESARK